MRKSSLSIHSENILPIIKKWLYSSREIFLRELISNASDAIKKMRMLQECGEAQASEQPFEIQVQIDAKQKTITISDNGIGMTEEEVEKYIAQIAFSGAEEFLAKYKKESDKDPIIGHFGLGFYSAYMVASKVELQTRSYGPDAKSVYWSCDGSSSYEIGEGTRSSRGTDVILHLDEGASEFLEEATLRKELERFCLFMPEPIFLNGKPMGNSSPLFLKTPSECTDQDYLAFYRKLYPMDPDPIFWIHLNVDYPFRLHGILYFPKVKKSWDNQSAIKLFCNRVFVSDDCRDILPDYLMLLRGAIDSPDIPLNVSRSYLQVDHNVRQLGSHISKKVSDRLNALYKTDKQRYIDHWSELEPLLKFGLLQDDKFYDRIKGVLLWKNHKGEWTTAEEYLDRAKEKKIYYCSEDCSPSIQKAFIDRGFELLFASAPLNAAVMEKLESALGSVKFQRIDSALDSALVDPAREQSLLDQDGRTAASRIAAFFRSNVGSEGLEIDAKSLVSDDLPGLMLLDESARRLRDYMALTGQSLPKELPVKKTLVINTNNHLVQSALQMADKDPALANALARYIHDSTLLSQQEIDPAALPGIIQRNHELMESLLKR